MIRTEIKQKKTRQLSWQALRLMWKRPNVLKKQETKLLEKQEMMLLIWRWSVPRKHFRPT